MKVSHIKYASANYVQELYDLFAWFNSTQAYLEVFSSGTTGAPKGIKHSRKSILQSAQLSVRFFEFSTNQTIVLGLPLNKIGGIMLAMRAFVADMEIIPVEPSRDLLRELPISTPIDFVSMAPNQLAASLHRLTNIKTVLVGGGPVSKNLLAQIKSLNPKTSIWQSYASTETISHVALRQLHPNASAHYKAMHGVSFSLTKQNCLVIDAPQIEVFKLETNDLVELLDQETFLWIGRHDNVVLSGGLKLYPEEIELKLNFSFPYFLDKEKDSALGERLILIMEEANFDATVSNLLKEKLSGVERPKAIYLVSALLFTETNKIQRQNSRANLKRVIEL